MLHDSFILTPLNPTTPTEMVGFQLDDLKQVWLLKLTGQWNYNPVASRSYVGFYNSHDPKNLTYIKLDTFYYSWDHLPTKDYKTAVLYKLLHGYRLRDEPKHNNQVFLGDYR